MIQTWKMNGYLNKPLLVIIFIEKKKKKKIWQKKLFRIDRKVILFFTIFKILIG